MQVLDLFAGSGSLGLEALSRGAAHATFVDHGKQALAVIRGNLRDLGLEDRATVLAGDAVVLAARHVPASPWQLVFVDPPYSTHLKYSGHPQCIGELDAKTGEYYEAMESVIGSIHRVLKNRRYMGLYVSDSYEKGEPFNPIGFELFGMLRKKFKPIDIVAVVRHNKSLKHPHWKKSALEGNYYLRGFNYLFIMKKED